jgi:hypothetical protein
VEKIKDLWGRYPRHWVDILALLVSLAAVGWMLSEPISGVLDIGFLVRSPAVYRLMIALVLVAIGYVIFDLLYFFSKRGAAVLLVKDASECVKANLCRTDCSEVRVFSSGGEDAKKRFLDLTQENFMPRKEIRIRVLLRGDQTSQRESALKALVDRWRKDIDEATSNRSCGYKFVTEFSVYEMPVMLRGYIFDSSVAVLSWYARDSKIRSSPNMPHMLLKSVSKHGEDVIKQAIESFDYFFGSGRSL